MKISDLPAGWSKVKGASEFRKALPNGDELLVTKTTLGWRLAEMRRGVLKPFSEYNTAGDAIDFGDRSFR